MNDREWIDCPCCGAKNSMEYKENIFEQVSVKGYPSPIEVGPLSGHICKTCGDGFYTKESMVLYEAQIQEGIARQTTSKDDKKIG